MDKINEVLKKQFDFNSIEKLGILIHQQEDKRGLILWDSNDFIYNPNNHDNTLYIEGRTDLITAVSLGLDEHFRLDSIFNKQSKINIENKNAEHIFLLDNDVTESEIKNQIVGEVPNKCKFIKFPIGKDLSEFIFLGGTTKLLHQLIISAKFFSGNDLKGKSNNNLNSFRDLYFRELPKTKWIVEDLIPEGYIILSGKTKSGKSWLAFQLAFAVAHEQLFLNNYKTNRYNVLFLALEDSEKRLQDRFFKMKQSFNIPEDKLSNLFHYAISINNHFEDSLKHLEEFIIKNKIELIIIDTLKRFTRSSKRFDKCQFDADYNVGMFLQDLSRKHGVSIIAILHNRKNVSLDSVYDNVAGTLGIQVAADTIAVLTRNQNFSTLDLTGRDIATITITLEFQEGIWKFLGNSDNISDKIFQIDWSAYILESSVRSEVLVSHLREVLTISRSTAYRLIDDAIKSGKISRARSGYYSLVQPCETIGQSDS